MMVRPILAGLVLLLAACNAPEKTAGPCERRVFENDGFIVCEFDARTQKLSLAWKSAGGTAFQGFGALSREIDPSAVSFAMNAGMFDAAGSPIGLYIEQGKDLRAINISAGPGNFHMMPNGVFWIDASGDPHVSTTDDYFTTAPSPLWATQSGPMLVIDGQLHPDFQHDGPSRYVRNGVGACSARTAAFVISDTPVSFGKFARFFRDTLGCPDALYLDGAVSSLWLPSEGRMDNGFPLGPIVVVGPR
jgi:uncharacterized protein YigE (DUF2233 family)